MISLWESLASTFGLSVTVLSAIFGIVLVVTISIASYLVFRSLVMAYVATLPAVLVANFIGLLPLWITAIVGVVTGMLLFSWPSYSDAGDGHTVAVDGDNYGSLGNSLKLAYAAKFGGRNPEFDKEVDVRIVQMQSLRKGPTREVAEAWLERMREFVEAR